MKKLILTIGIIIFSFALSEPALAQIIPDTDRSGSSQSLFPLLGYTSDLGLFGGVVYQRIDYADSRRPFLSNTIVDVIGSTNGIWIGKFDYERIEMFGRPIRSHSRVELELNPVRSYYGIGNNTDFSRSEFDNGIYFLNQKHALIRIQGRKALAAFGNDRALDGVLRLKSSYTTTDDRGSDTRFILTPPEIFDDGWVNTIGIGLIFDSRENEFDPRYGQRTEIGADISGSLLGSSYSYNEIFLDSKAFLTLTKNTALAQRISLRYSYGDTPFWELPSLGSSRSLRGYSLDRFIGDSSVLYMAELRRWLFSFLEGEVKIGGHVFYDTGRVFSQNDSDGLFSEWKNTFGFGGAMSLFNPDLIFRGEIGFSDEDYRIYAGVGFAF